MFQIPSALFRQRTAGMASQNPRITKQYLKQNWQSLDEAPPAATPLYLCGAPNGLEASTTGLFPPNAT